MKITLDYKECLHCFLCRAMLEHSKIHSENAPELWRNNKTERMLVMAQKIGEVLGHMIVTGNPEKNILLTDEILAEAAHGTFGILQQKFGKEYLEQLNRVDTEKGGNA